MINWIGSSNRQIFSEKLYIPYAGGRAYYNASPYSQGSTAFFWLSSPSDSYSLYLLLANHDSFLIQTQPRATGLPVRCFYNLYQSYNQSFTLSFEVSEDNGSTSAST